MNEQYLSTSRLGNVMRLIALGRQSGILYAFRIQGGNREEGEIQFNHGEIQWATMGPVRNSDNAINLLKAWGDCSYYFMDGEQKLRPDVMPPTQRQSDTGSLPPNGSGSLSMSQFTTGTPSQYQGDTIPTAYPPLSQSNPGQFQPGGSNPGAPSQSGPWPAQTPPSGPYTGTNGYYNQPASPPPSQRGLPPQQLLQRLQQPGYTPRRITATDASTATQLGRGERQVLLLIDGQRTIPDLARLTRRDNNEVCNILAQLMGYGLVA